jgi:hypothetical protein
MHAPRPWPQRFLTALVHSDRFIAVCFLVMTFSASALVGATWTTSREVDRRAREAQQLLAPMPSRPTLHQRLDAIEQRLQAIDERLSP